MIADLKPYPIMRDSGVVWLGEVPKDWNVLRGRQLFEIKKRISGQLGHPVISVTQKGLRVKDVESGEGQLSQDYSKYQTVEVGEFAMNSMDLLTGGVGIATAPGVTSPDYRVFTIRAESRCCDRYMLQVLRMLYLNRGFYAWGQGSAQLGRWRLPRKRFNNFPFPVPPFTEQVAIARFLDWANGRLERAIRAKRKVIALLNEQRQAIIHRAVTRGLDPSVPLKPSGIPCLGDIPKHWEMQRLKRVCRVQGGYAFPSSAFDETGIPVVRMNNLRRGVLNMSGVARIPEAECVQAFNLRAGDILYGLSGSIGATGSLGNYAVVTEHDLPAMLNQRVARFVPRPGRIDPRFLIQLLQSSIFYEQVLADTTGTAQFNVSTNDIENVALGLPPLGEQERIVSRIGGSAAPLATTISRLEREIELLREYRTRLVADVVTGKLDVRAVAARLPDEIAPDTAEEDADVGDEIEPVDEEAAL